jgi:hypothetical protein
MIGDQLRVDTAQELTLTHPLVRGMRVFWFPLPHTVGGSPLVGISPYSLVGERGAGTSWTTTEKSYAVTYDGTNTAYSKFNNAVNFGSPYTLVGYVRFGDLSEDRGVISINNSSSGEWVQSWVDRQNDEIKIASNDGTITSETGSSLQVGQWYWVSIEYDGNNFSVLVDGSLEATIGGSPNLSNATTFLGAGNGESSKNLSGDYAAWGGWQRILSDDEYAQVFTQYQLGFPELLNRRGI